jgi:DNA-binding response OmpR family regulator
MKKNILVVDDNRQDIKIITRVLNKAGFKDISTAVNGEDAVLKAKEEKPGLVILDTVLPGIDGFEVCRRIRKSQKSKTTKIIVTTGAIDAVDAGKARSAGADDYVVKSADFSHLLNAVKGIFAPPRGDK